MKVVDMHCDTIGAIYECRKSGQAIDLKKNNLHLDLEKMKKGDYLLQNFAMFIDLKKYKDSYKTLTEMIDCYNEEIDKNSEVIAKVLNYDDIEKNSKEGKMSALLTIEDGGALEGSYRNLQEVYNKGVRMITLSWNYPNGVGYPNLNLKLDEKGNILENPDFTIPNIKYGLTPWGIEMVEAMESLGVIPDVSHLSDAGFYDVLKYTKKPFVASHSNARAICNHVRNMDDNMIRALANRGGVMGINFCAVFIQPTPHKEKVFGTIEDTVKHIKYIKNIGGIDCIGLGTDFDGIPSNIELKDGSFMPLLADRLLKEKFTEEEVEKIFHKNVLRLYKEVL